MKKIIFSYPVYASFVRNDESLLKQHFKVKSFYLNQKKSVLLFYLIKQFFFLLFQSFGTELYVSFFAGYSSFLPGLFSKVFSKPHLIILGGTDCVSFPSIRYGNYQKKILGWVTCSSLKMATHLAPVSENLINSVHTYTKEVLTRQGYKNFCPKCTALARVIHLGYDAKKFYKSTNKKNNSFITVGQINNRTAYFRKGIDLIFKIAPQFPTYQFTIVGNLDKMKYSNIPENITLLAFVQYEQLRDLYSMHEFYLQLSISEGFPSAPCEAMLCECIPIVSNVAALPLIVGDSGFILKSKNEDLLIDLIQKAVLCDKALMGKKARQQIIENFPMNEREKLVHFLNAIINNEI